SVQHCATLFAGCCTGPRASSGSAVGLQGHRPAPPPMQHCATLFAECCTSPRASPDQAVGPRVRLAPLPVQHCATHFAKCCTPPRLARSAAAAPEVENLLQEEAGHPGDVAGVAWA